MSRRLQAMGLEKYSAGFKTIRTHEEEVKRPFTWNKPRKVFVNSMSDLFHKEVPLDFIQRVFTTMNKCPKHQFQVLTKRAELLEQYSPSLIWTPNIWMGVSVEDQRVQYRIDHLRKCGAHIKFLSLEPLLGPLPDLDLTGIHWVIVGGESGRNPRPMKEEWVEDIRQQCIQANVAFFFKQWGGINKKAAGRILNGEIYSAMPQLA
jgi:protein gp37